MTNNISLDEANAKWEFDSNWAMVRLKRKSTVKSDKEDYKKTYICELTAKIVSDTNIFPYSINITYEYSLKDMWSNKSPRLFIDTVFSGYYENVLNFLRDIKKNKKLLPGLTDELVKNFLDYQRENMRESIKSFKDKEIDRDKIEDYLSEAIDEAILDETTLKDLLTAAGVLGLAGVGMHTVTQDPFPNKATIDLDNGGVITQDYQAPDILKVPDYKDMPNLWKDTEPQKVSVEPKKAEPKKDIKPARKPEVKKPVSKNKWTDETWTDAEGNNFSLDSACEYLVGHEDFSPKAYSDGYTRDKNGKKVSRYSIGYGTKAKGPRDTITREQAKKDMINHIKKNILPKYKFLVFPTQNQFNSAISFSYNTGKIPPLNNQGEIDWRRFTSYNNFKGKENDALQRRRNAEFFNAQLMDM